MAFWPLLLIWAGVTAIHALLRPRVPRPPDAKPEKFQGITSEEGRPWPVLWGTRQIRQINVGWWGNTSQAAIVQSGVTTGYQYFLGASYLLCMGEVDEVVDIRVSDQPIGTPVTAANNGIRFGAVPPTFVTGEIPVQYYGKGQQLALAVENVMNAAEPAKWKVTYGYVIEAGRNDAIEVQIQFTGQTYLRKARIRAGEYATLTALVAAIQEAMTAIEVHEGSVNNVTFTVSESGGVIRITSQFGSFTFVGWQILGPGHANFSLSDTALSTLGFAVTAHLPDPNGLVSGSIAVLANRFTFGSVVGTATLKLTDAAFTAATILGFTTVADVTLSLTVVQAPNAFSLIGATFTDQGDFLQVDVNAPNVFGTEGGISGRLDIFKGKPLQAASDYLTTQYAAPGTPAHRRFCYAVQRGMYVGNTAIPRPISITLRRCPNQLGLTGEAHNIGGDANAACMIWEALTDTTWGLGLSTESIDRDAFLAVGETLAEEGLGLSMIVDAVTSTREIIRDIMRHVDGVFYVDHLTGKIGIKLIRADYVLADLPPLTNRTVRLNRMTRMSFDKTRNVVRVHYTSRLQGYTERVADAMDLANIELRGGEQSVEEMQFPGLSGEANALRVADRELRAVAQPFAQLELLADRRGWKLRPGSPFRFSYEPYGIVDMPCRVTRITPGTLEDGKIIVDAVEDVFDSQWSQEGSEPPGEAAGYGLSYGDYWGGV